MDSLLEFPCEFPIKVFGQSNVGLDEIVAQLAREHCGDLLENAISQRPSKQGNYSAITVNVYVTSREQLDNLYIALSSHPNVRMVL